MQEITTIKNEIEKTESLNVELKDKSRNTVLFEYVALCPNCHKKAIILNHKIKRFKLCVCPYCHKKTHLAIIGNIKRYGKKEIAKIKFIDSVFKSFWVYVIKDKIQ